MSYRKPFFNNGYVFSLFFRMLVAMAMVILKERQQWLKAEKYACKLYGASLFDWEYLVMSNRKSFFDH